MKKTKLLTLFGASLVAGSLSAATIVNSVDELSFSYSGGASESSSGGGNLVINTSKNSFATASLPNSYILDTIGDTISMTFDFTLDNLMIDDGGTNPYTSTFLMSFGGGHDFQVSLKIVDTSQSIVFSESGDPNLGKFNSNTTFGTSTHSMTFGLEKTGADEMSLSYSSPTLSATTRTVTNDVTPVGTFTFDTLYYNFRGDGWNEDFSGDTINATISSLTVDTTGTVIPEPSTFALLGLALGSLLLLKRK